MKKLFAVNEGQMQTPIQIVIKKIEKSLPQKTLRNLRKHRGHDNFKLYYLVAVFILLVNVKIPTIVGILIFMNRINFMLS